MNVILILIIILLTVLGLEAVLLWIYANKLVKRIGDKDKILQKGETHISKKDV